MPRRTTRRVDIDVDAEDVFTLKQLAKDRQMRFDVMISKLVHQAAVAVRVAQMYPAQGQADPRETHAASNLQTPASH